MKVLLTSASFQGVPGMHSQLLYRQGYDITAIKGPLTGAAFLPIIAGFDALLCGDDEVTAEVLQAGHNGRLKYISKYGVGVDKIDIAKAKQLGIPVTICPGVNQYAVAELVFGLLLSFARNIHLEYAVTKAGGWDKMTGFELYDKTIGIVGFGAIGREVALRAKAFGMHVLVNTRHPGGEALEGVGATYISTLDELAQKADILTLHVPHTPETNEIINHALINNYLKKGAIIINTARGKLINNEAVKAGLENGTIAGYLTDVLDIEPMPANHPLQHAPNTLITPHIGSRTWQSVERQGLRAVENLISMLKGDVESYKSFMAYQP